MQLLYLASLLFSLFGLHTLDKKFKLALYHDAKRTIICLLIPVALFIAWDAVGIATGIFFHGGSTYSLPLRLAPEFPIEELFFLILLSYTTLLLYVGWERRCSPTS